MFFHPGLIIFCRLLLLILENFIYFCKTSMNGLLDIFGMIGVRCAYVWRFYRDGFRNMTVGRWLWAMILIKLFILFGIFKLFFFPDLLQRDYSTDEERADAVRSSLLDNR